MEVNGDTIDYRMKNIESQIAEINAKIDKLTNAITEATFNNRDKEKDINMLNERVTKVENQIIKINEKLTELEKNPLRKDAKHWQETIDYILKTILGVAVLAILAKIRLK